jgi:hypothetical protein
MEQGNKKINETIISIIEDSTIHGIPRLVKPNSWISKIAWILFFIGSISYCLYLIVTALLSFLQYNTVTNIQTITEIPANFPVITICNLNQLQTNISFDFIQRYSNLKQANLIKNFQLISQLSSYNDSFKKSLSYPLNESLLSCMINSMSCSSLDFVWSFDPLYGNCYSFNKGLNSSGNSIALIKISKSGNMNGFRLELFIGNPKNIPNFIQTFGYHVIIHNQTYKISFNEGFDITTGMETNFAIKRLYETLKPKPYSECIDLDSIDSFDSYFYRVIYGLNQTYRQIDCFDLCFQQTLIQTCNCYLNTFNKLNGTIQCLDESQLYCSVFAWRSFLSNDYMSKICVQYCPLECKSVNYQITTTFSNYPSYNYALDSLMNNPIIKSKFQNETLTYDLIKQSVLSLNVYYDHLAYTHISKDAKLEIVDLVSGIGGLLGLFLGMSFLSFAELIEMFIETLIIILGRLNLKKNVKKIKPAVK